MKITKVTFEGTPDEFKAIDNLFTDNPASPNSSHSEDINPILDPKVAYKAMLKRLPIPNGQMDAYKALANGELEYPEYLRIMGRSWNQVAGVHGALGRRINNTKAIHQAGLPGNIFAIAYWRKDDEAKDYFGLKSDFLEVLREERII